MNDQQAITAVVQTYFDSMFEADGSKAHAAFHPDARITGYMGGTLTNMTVTEFADFVGQQPSGKAKGDTPCLEILSLHIAGDTAIARVRDEYLGTLFIDTLTFLRVDEEWRIHNKLFHVETADEAHHRPPVWVGHIHLKTPALEASEQFMLDLGMRRIFANDTVKVLELRGGTHIVIQAADTSERDPFDLMVEDIDAVHAQLRAAGINVGELSRGNIHDEFNVTEPGGAELRFMSTHVPDHSLV